MKKINKELSLYNIYARGFTLVGALMLVMSVCRFFQDNKTLTVIAFILSVLATLFSLMPLLFKRQKADEMFRKNFEKAGLNTFCMLFVSIGILWGISCIFVDRFVIDFYEFGPVLMGLLVFTFGVFISKYERGDA